MLAKIAAICFALALEMHRKRDDVEIRQVLSSATKIFALTDSPPRFVAGNGSWLYDLRGKEYLDFACGSGVTSLGHGNPSLISAVKRQLDTGLSHAGPHFATPTQVECYRLIGKILPEQLCRMHPATNGTEATETALKAAMYFTGGKDFLAFKGGYHGRTLGSLAVSSKRGVSRFLGALKPNTRFLEFGCNQSRVQKALDVNPKPAGIVLEAIQATNGMIFPPRGWLRMLADLSYQNGVPLIVDEVFTGFARSGLFFAIEREKIVPDLLVLGKSLGGGFPSGLVVGRDEIMSAWLPGTQSSTFQFHPVSAAAALASLEMMIDIDAPLVTRKIGRYLQENLKEFEEFPFVAEIRGSGAMFGIEIVSVDGHPDQTLAASIRSVALEKGLVTWECGAEGHVIGLVPPFVVNNDELDFGIKLLRDAILVASELRA